MLALIKWQLYTQRLLPLGALFLCLFYFSGCAPLKPNAGADSELLTPSEESEVRRRARIRLELASNYFESGQTNVALDEIRQALNTDPLYADAHNLLGLIYMRLNEYAKSEESFIRALDLRPSDASILHNKAWLLCLQKKYPESDESFIQVLASTTYAAKSKTLMAQGLCQARAGKEEEAEKTLLRSYELDAGNPVVAYHLSGLLFRRNEVIKAQFYIRRLNNSELSNAETLWLGIQVERALDNTIAMKQLADQLRKRFPDSREQLLYKEGAF